MEALDDEADSFAMRMTTAREPIGYAENFINQAVESMGLK